MPVFSNASSYNYWLHFLSKNLRLRQNPLPPAPNCIQHNMKLLNTYDDRDEAEDAAEKLTGNKRLASERDGTVVIYNLFGIPSWGNFHRLGMYNLDELKTHLYCRASWQEAHQVRHAEITATLQTVAKNYGIDIPEHWL